MALSADQVARLKLRREIALHRKATRKPKPDPRPPAWPVGPRMRYTVALLGVVRELERAVREQLKPRLPDILAAAARDLNRADAPADDGQGAIAAVRAELERVITPDRIANAAREAAVDTSRQNQAELRRWLKAKTGFDAAPGVGENLERQFSAFVKQNVSLIQGLTDEALGKIEDAVLRGVREGRRVEQVTKEIARALDIAKSRAALIATDQVASINGEITRIRHTRMGIATYRWSTSKDERVRPGHRQLEGTVQKWATPPVVDPKSGRRAHPGGDVRCRCAAVPVVDELLASLGINAA